MNPRKQLWALFKFQALVLRNVLFFPALISLPLLVSTQVSVVDLDLAISNLFVFIILTPSLMVLVPFAASTSLPNRGVENPTEFLITRAVDRHVLYRSRTVLLYLILMVVPFALLLYSLHDPDVQTYLGKNAASETYLSHIPGSTLVASKIKDAPPEIFIPAGKPLIAGWHLWSFLVLTLALQLLFLARFKHTYRFANLPTIWKLSFIGIWALLIIFSWDAIGNFLDFANKWVFLIYASHQSLFWIYTALTFLFCQLWGERRFARLE